MSVTNNQYIRKGTLEKMKKNKSEGITVIALVVTIIILLILAGITIMILTRRKWNT